MIAAEIPFKDVSKNITVNIAITRHRYGVLRLKCAVLLFSFAAYIGGINGEFEVKTK